MGGRSGQSTGAAGGATGSGGDATQADYDLASQDDNYKSYKTTGSIEEKTIYEYTGRGSQINYSLREGSLKETDKAYIRNLDKSLDKEKSYRGVVYRGINSSKDLESIRKNVGGTIQYKEYLSTSKSKNRTEVFGKAIVFVIKSKRGKDISDKSSIRTEQEVLFKRGSKFKIEKVVDNTVYLKEK
jgi:hypothetical protein